MNVTAHPVAINARTFASTPWEAMRAHADPATNCTRTDLRATKVKYKNSCALNFTAITRPKALFLYSYFFPVYLSSPQNCFVFRDMHVTRALGKHVVSQIEQVPILANFLNDVLGLTNSYFTCERSLNMVFISNAKRVGCKIKGITIELGFKKLLEVLKVKCCLKAQVFGLLTARFISLPY